MGGLDDTMEESFMQSDSQLVRGSQSDSGLKKKIVWFRFPTDPVNLCATQIILWVL